MESERIVFLDRASLIAEVRRPAFPHMWQEYAASTPEEVLQKLQHATIAITNKVPLRREVLVQLPDLRMVAVAATGTEHVDLDCCRERGVSVANIRNYAVHAVPEHVFMLILALRRNLLAYREDLRQGLWRQASQFCLFTHPLRDLYGSTLGIVGYGALGQEVARLGEAFGMRWLAAEHKGASALRPGFTAFEQVLQESDVVTLHAPLNAQPDSRAGACPDATPRAAHQHRARRVGGRAGAGRRIAERGDWRCGLRCTERGAAAPGQCPA